MPESDWIQIDKHYQSRIALRKELMRRNRDQVLRAIPSARPTIQNLYSYIVGNYLPSRYIDMFKIIPKPTSPRQNYLHNLVTGDQIPLEPSAESVLLLEALGRQVEEDFLILEPEPESGEFMLTAYVGCFPNGFDWQSKLGKTMSEIHVPVPDYATKLKKSMNRYLSRVECGQFVKRHNVRKKMHFSLQTETRIN
jgi:hypothetical protein